MAEPEPHASIGLAVDERLSVALGKVIDPEIRRPILDLDMVSSATLGADGVARAAIELTVVGCPAAQQIESDVRSALETVAGPGRAEVTVGVMSPEKRAALTQRLRAGRARGNAFGADSLTTIVAVASGKGGVGKSTVAVNLAVSLAAAGKRVGILDADVHGFSVPRQLGLTGVTPTRINDLIVPPVAHGVKAISIGMFVGSDEPIAWRGPILHRTLTQFVSEVFFGDLDVLIVDLPPGTGDIAISAGQLMPTAGVVVVTTPQVAASEVAIRSGQLALKLGQRVLGVIENMSWMDRGGERLELFGSGGGAAVAHSLTQLVGYDVPLLGQVPFDESLRIGGDAGVPLSVSDPSSPAAKVLASVAQRVALRPDSLVGRKLPLSVSRADADGN